MTKMNRAMRSSHFVIPDSFVIRHSSFQSSFVKLDQIEISPNILASLATGLFQKMEEARLFGGSVWMP